MCGFADMWQWYLWWCIYVALRSNYCYDCIKPSLNIISDEVTGSKLVTVYSATVTEWARFQRERTKMDGFTDGITRPACGLSLNILSRHECNGLSRLQQNVLLQTHTQSCPETIKHCQSCQNGAWSCVGPVAFCLLKKCSDLIFVCLDFFSLKYSHVF